MKLRSVILLFAVFGLVLFSCQEVPDEDLEGALGVGVGGPTVGAGLVAKNLTKSNGEVIATYRYDGAYFLEMYGASSSADTVFQSLVDFQGDGIQLSLLRSVGRPDTACRYQAALLARDEDFEIDLTGDRENTNGIDVYQVEIHKASDFRGFFCSELKDGIGVLVAVQASSKDALGYEQIYFVLNSIEL
ncbi:MAG: hypothetical protein GY866_27230 [Proteobacteria bacterium]|nr:hypothetical protein [Pseudomonadota bacterium]